MEFSGLMMMGSILGLFITLAYALWRRMYVYHWLTPLQTKEFLEAQGLQGMPYKLLFGNTRELIALGEEARASPMPSLSHDIAPRIIPNYYKWAKEEGKPFFFWFGPQVRIVLNEPEQAREVLSNKFGHYPKTPGRPDTQDLIGDGLVTLDGEKWAHHRRILSPAFFIDKLKAMTSTMGACTTSMLDNWQAQVEMEASGCKEIEVHMEFRNLTADIISHTAFGSSYEEGKLVFDIQHEQQVLFNKVMQSIYLPGSRFLPTSTNRYRWRLENQIQKKLRKMIHTRMESIEQQHGDSNAYDLLGLMMAANKKELQGNQKNLSMTIGEMVDECKTFFFAGHETTTTLLTWTFLLLGIHTEWQHQAREEVLQVCGKDPPTADSLNNLKIVGMVLNEALRLYPPAFALTRMASREMKLGENLIVPKGSSILIPIIAFQHNPKYWGSDAKEFNPHRFNDGIAKASSNPIAFMPFGLGPRNCVGQTFAMLEAKVALSMILQRFTFCLSPAYIHAPTIVLTLQPKYGMKIIFTKLGV